MASPVAAGPENRPMTCTHHHTLLLADSEVARLEIDGGDLRLHFSAAAVRQQIAGAAPVEGHARGVVWHLTGAHCEGAVTDALGRLREGRLRHGDRWRGEVTLPTDLAGPLTLELQFANGTLLNLNAQALRSEAPVPLPFTESLAC
jgi:hypothetical protein